VLPTNSSGSFRILLVGVAPTGRIHWPSNCSRAIFSCAPASEMRKSSACGAAPCTGKVLAVRLVARRKSQGQRQRACSGRLQPTVVVWKLVLALHGSPGADPLAIHPHCKAFHSIHHNAATWLEADRGLIDHLHLMRISLLSAKSFVDLKCNAGV